MPDLWFWLVLGVVNAGLVWAVLPVTTRRAREASYLRGYDNGHKAGRAYEVERNLNLAAADEADRKATIRKNRSEGSKAAWVTRKQRHIPDSDGGL